MSDYKPTENDGLRKDGQPDQRVGTGEFAYGKVDPSEAGKQGGHTGGSGQDGANRGGGKEGSGQFAHGKVDPHEAGKQSGGGSGQGDTSEDGLRKDGQPDMRLKQNKE